MVGTARQSNPLTEKALDTPNKETPRQEFLHELANRIACMAEVPPRIRQWIPPYVCFRWTLLDKHFDFVGVVLNVVITRVTFNKHKNTFCFAWK